MLKNQLLDLGDLSSLFKALSDPTRLRIVALLAHGELCVCHLEAALEAPQSTVSRHLAVLKAERLVESRRLGSWVHYRLRKQSEPQRSTALRTLISQFFRVRALKLQHARLTSSVGPGACR